jgi:hypothetical protein
VTATDYPDWGTSQDQANKISTTGAPLLNLKTVLVNAATNVNNPGGSSVRGPYTFTQLSYELHIGLETNVAPVGTTNVSYQLEWSDSASGLIVKRKTFVLVAGPNGTPHQVEINGPARADTLNITIANNASSGVASKTTFTLLQSSRDYSEDSYRTIDFQQSGWTGGSPRVEVNVLAQFGSSVGAGGSQERLMAAYSGLAYVTANTTGNNATLQLTVAEAATATPFLGVDPDCLFIQSNAAGFINQLFYIPNVQQALTVNNSDAAAHTINCQIVGLNQPGD